MNANLTIDERRWNCRRQLLLDLEESDQNREERPLDFKNWRTQEWIDHFDQRQQAKVSILCGLCESILYMRPPQGHSGGKTELVDPTLQDDVRSIASQFFKQVCSF